MTKRINELLAIMARLRAVDGCPWDRVQTFASIAPYTLEEAYEVVDAIERGDVPGLRDELGDLLLQVVFHAQIAREAGHFDFETVAAAICDKLVRRHPHVFAATEPLSVAEQTVAWEDIKTRERGTAATHGDASQLAGIARALPALLRTQKLSKRAAGAGFDFADAVGAADKVAEELAEARAAAATAGSAGGAGAAAVFEEIGDLLFAATNFARKLGVDPEAALRAANGKFERRFRGMEALAAARGTAFESLDPSAQERLWQEMKRRE